MNNAENKKVMAHNIRRYMSIKGVSNQQVCADLNIKYTTFMDWINAVTYPRIGKVEAMANYFGCEKSDLIEDWSKKPTGEDGLSDNMRALLKFAQTVPEEKAEVILRVMKTIVEDN